MTGAVENKDSGLFSKLKLAFTEQDVIFFSLLILVYISVYYLPMAIGLIINFGVAVYCYNSKHPLILLFLFIILNTRMNNLLDINSLPRISLAGNSVNIIDFLNLSMWIKVLKNYRIIFRSAFGKIFIMAYLVLFITVAINALGSGFDKGVTINMIRAFSCYICYFYLLISFKDLSDYNFILKVLFFITLIVVANQISLVFTSQQLNTVLLGQEMGDRASKLKFTNYTGNYQSDKSRGIVFDGTDPLMLLVSCLALLGLSRDAKMRNFMLISMVLVIMTGLIEAGRSYMVFILFPFLAYFKNMHNIYFLGKIFFITIVVMLLVFILIGGFDFTFFHDILLRLSGVIKVLSSNTRGDVETAVGRLNAAKRSMEVISKSPIIGHGFSKTTGESVTSDLGFLNTIVTMGMIGLFVYLYLIIKFISMCSNIIVRTTSSNPYRLSIQVFMFAMFGFVLGYATSMDFFSSGNQNMAFIGMFLGLFEVLYRRAQNFEFNRVQQTV